MNEQLQIIINVLIGAVALFLIVLTLGMTSLVVAIFFKAHQTIKERKNAK